MNATEIFKKLTDDMALIYRNKVDIKSSTEREHAFLAKQKELAATISSTPSLAMFGQNMAFRSIETGAVVFFGNESSTHDEKISDLVHRHNRQLQWLLADAYEVFELFLREIYACAGYNDNSLWSMSDFGDEPASVVKNKDYEWFVARSKGKRDVPRGILNVLANKFTRIKRAETINNFEVNIRLAIILIAHLRHVSVHGKGDVKNKDKFIGTVLKDSGFYNNGSFDPQLVDFINQFFGAGVRSNTIRVFEIALEERPSFYVDMFEMLTNYLIAYADLVTRSISGHLAARDAAP